MISVAWTESCECLRFGEEIANGVGDDEREFRGETFVDPPGQFPGDAVEHFVIKGIEVAEACANTLHSLERLRGQVAAGIVG